MHGSKIIHPVIYFNIPTRIFEFTAGMFFSRKILPNPKLAFLFSFLSLSYILIHTLFLKQTLSSTNMLNILSCVCFSLCLCTTLSCLHYNQLTKSFLIFTSKYSYVAFIYHHQIIICLSSILLCSHSITKNIVVSYLTLSLSYFAAYLTYGYASRLKRYLLLPLFNNR